MDTRALLLAINKRLVTAVTAAGFGMAIVGLAIVGMMPLKRTVPYVVHDNTSTGEVVVEEGQTATEFKPEWLNEAFFLRRWISDLFTINRYLTVSQYDPRAKSFIRGQNAMAEYDQFRKDDQTFDRLVQDPALTRDVQSTLTPVAGTKNGAVAEVTLTTHEHGNVVVAHKQVTVYYVILPSTDLKTLVENPLGIYVTDFKITSEE